MLTLPIVAVGMTPFPEYVEDPIDARVAAAREELARQKAKMGPTFKPTSGPKSTRTRPIAYDVSKKL